MILNIDTDYDKNESDIVADIDANIDNNLMAW